MTKKRKAESRNREHCHSGLDFHPIDSILKFTKQRRSPAPKRRSHLSIFLSSSSASCAGSNSGSTGHGLSSKTTISFDNNEGGEESSDPPLVQVIRSIDKRSRPLSDFYEVPVGKVESIPQAAPIDPFVDRHKIDTTARLEPTPKRVQVMESNPIFVHATSTGHAKTACLMPLSAEMIGETSSLADSRSQDIDGQFLLQLSGDHCSAWDDQARDLSKFQDALEMMQAPSARQGPLHGSPDGSSRSNQLDHSRTNKWTPTISSRTEGSRLKRGNGNREQKEAMFPLKRVPEVRRFKIMRHLGLVAPIGSPF